MDLSEEEFYQYRECPQEDIVDIFVHAPDFLLGTRHGIEDMARLPRENDVTEVFCSEGR
jgi:hypothetical protein